MTTESPKFKKLVAKLRELFELDKADLDFGIYRVLRARRDEIDRFLREELLPQVQRELGVVTDEKAKQFEAKVEEEIQLVMNYGGKSREEAELAEPVKKARILLEQARNPAAIEDEVYSLLTTFFGRYYEGGDFISLRRYSGPGKERYMLPYNGEEVKLVWANMDQYYIKSAENFRDYAFRIPPLEADQHVPEPDLRRCVRFKLVEASSEKDNVKTANGKRLFALADLEEHPLAVSVQDGVETLEIPFTYALHGKDAKQEALLQEAVSGVMEHADLTSEFKAGLSILEPTEKRPERTILEKHLESYAAKNSFDYFIHKDLGGFLNRELDYFLKSDVLRVDDLLTEDENTRALTLKKAKAFKLVAEKIVTFLHRLEQFQKKLWLKKKFVVETRYCVTLDRVSEELYPEICACDAQWKEWEASLVLKSSERTIEFLRRHRSLVIDTKFYSEDFKHSVISSIGDAGTEIGGVCFQGDNFDALRLAQDALRENISTISIDPPYNTGSDGFCYKDRFQSASWLAQQNQLLPLAKDLLTRDGSLFAFCDENEIRNFAPLIESVYGQRNVVETIIWNKRIPKNDKGIGNIHDFILLAAKDLEFRREHGLEYKMRKDEIDDIYELVRKARAAELSIADAQTELKKFYRKQGYDRGLTLYCELDENYEIWGKINMSWPNAKTEGPRYEVVNPVTGVPAPVPDNGWRWKEETFREAERNGPTFVLPDGSMMKGRIWYSTKTNIQPSSITYLREVESFLLRSILSVKSDGSVTLENLGLGGLFDYPKSVLLLERLLFSAQGNSGWIMDFFAGSGTTGQAIINLNREDSGSRRFFLAEMGEYFESVLIPRLKKVIYSPDWSGGSPSAPNEGISQAFKVLHLETYEDCLNNLILNRTEAQQELLEANASVCEDYLLGYFLDVETKGSVLQLDRFTNPWAYQLNIATGNVGETKPTNVDLVETFNWLLGMQVEHISIIEHLRPDKGFKEDDNGRLQLASQHLRSAKPEENEDCRSFQTVEGTLHTGEKTLIIWRTLTKPAKNQDAARALEEDNLMLEEFLSRKAINPREKQWDLIYVNGDHTLDNLAERLSLDAKSPEEAVHFKVRTIEPEFQRLMFEGVED